MNTDFEDKVKTWTHLIIDIHSKCLDIHVAFPRSLFKKISPRQHPDK